MGIDLDKDSIVVLVVLVVDVVSLQESCCREKFLGNWGVLTEVRDLLRIVPLR